MKIMIAEFGQETNTFSPDRIGFDRLAPTGYIKADTIIRDFTGTGTYLGGALAAAGDCGVEVIPLDSVEINGGAPMTAQCLADTMEALCRDIAAHVQEADGLFLAMHGGGAAEGIEDLEIHTLRCIRQVIGPDFPITSSLDMHSNLSQELLELSDGLFVIKEFPHSDMATASYLATTELIRMIRTGEKPVMTLVNLPMILPNTTTCTLLAPMKPVKEYFAQYQREHGILDVSLVQGFSANDQYWAGVSVLIVDRQARRAEAEHLARYFWEKRVEFAPQSRSAQQAVEEAAAYDGTGYVVINESTDNPGSGCPGDGTHLLRRLLEQDRPGSVFMNIYDPVAAEQAAKAGVGAVLDLTVGGRTAPVCGEPVLLSNAQVLNVSDGSFVFQGVWRHGAKTSLGTCVRVKCGNVEVVIASVRDQSFDDGPLRTTGVCIDDYRIVALKSANHFRGFFQDRAGLIIPCETPGLRPTDLKTYPYKKIRRPIYPLDADTEF